MSEYWPASPPQPGPPTTPSSAPVSPTYLGYGNHRLMLEHQHPQSLHDHPHSTYSLMELQQQAFQGGQKGKPSLSLLLLTNHY